MPKTLPFYLHAVVLVGGNLVRLSNLVSKCTKAVRGIATTDRILIWIATIAG